MEFLLSLHRLFLLQLFPSTFDYDEFKIQKTDEVG